MSNYVSPEENKLFYKQLLKFKKKEQLGAREPYYKHLCGMEIKKITTKLEKLCLEETK